MQRATTQLPGDPDADLLGDLRRLFAASDPVPEHLLAAARLALGAQPIDVPRPGSPHGGGGPCPDAREIANRAGESPVGLAKSPNRVTTSSKPDSPA